MCRDSNAPHLHSLRKLRLVHLDLESTFHISTQIFISPVCWKDFWFQHDRTFTDTNGFSAIKYRSGISADLVIPIRDVTTIFSILSPSSTTWRSEAGESMSFPLSRARVIPSASHNFPGPLASFCRL